MKKLFLIACCLTATTLGFAQRASSSSSSFFSTEKADAKVTVGIRGGLNIARLRISDGSENETLGARPGFYLGMNVDIPITQSLYFQTGLLFTQKGYKETEKAGNTKVTRKANPGYLEIPLLASYRYGFNDNVQLQVSTGPYLAVGICGKWKNETTNGLQTYKGKVDFFGDEDDNASMGLQRFDMGWQVGLGITIKKFYVGYAFEAGFIDLDREDDESIKTRNHMISVGYNF